MSDTRKAEITGYINNMTHKQLMRFAKILGLRGDFMKGDNGLSATDYLRNRVHAAIAILSLEELEAKLLEAFPGGFNPKGRGYYRRSSSNAASAYGDGHSADMSEQMRDESASEKTAKVPANTGDIGAALKLLQEALGANQQVNPEQVRAIVRKELEGIVLPVTVQLKTESGEVKKLEGIHHRRFPELMAKVQAGVNVWLAGPAGTGKTTAAHNVAKALELPFYFNGAIDNEYKLLGFTDAQGRIVSRPFRKAFQNGGVYLFDEVDASMPAALLAFNAAMANGHCDFPDGCIERHKDFKVIAAANTFGHGANADYVGRARMDGAFLDRFVTQTWEIDETLERALAGNDKWTTYVQDVRKRVHAKGIKVIISPRASLFGATMLASGISWEECQTSCLRKGMSDEQWAGVRG